MGYFGIAREQQRGGGRKNKGPKSKETIAPVKRKGQNQKKQHKIKKHNNPKDKTNKGWVRFFCSSSSFFFLLLLSLFFAASFFAAFSGGPLSDPGLVQKGVPYMTRTPKCLSHI